MCIRDSGTSPHIVDPRYPGAVEEIVNLGNHWNRLLLRNDKKDIIELTDSISEHFTACYAKLAKAGSLLESQMKKTASKIDMPTLRNIIQELTNTVYRSGASRSRNLFSTAVTPRGLISFAAVSYTHLDVYKRQSKLHLIFWREFFQCTRPSRNQHGRFIQSE